MSDIPIYDPTAQPAKKLTADEIEIQQLCNFERYRDIVDKRRVGGQIFFFLLLFLVIADSSLSFGKGAP